MSNKLNLPSINPWSNVEVKGTLDVTGLITAAGGIAISAPLTLPSGSALKYQMINIFVPNIVGAAGAICVEVSQIAGTIESMSAVLNNTTATGSLVLTGSIGGVAITTGAITVPIGTATGTAVTVAPTANNTLAVGSVLRITLSGTQDAVGTGSVSFRVLVA